MAGHQRFHDLITAFVQNLIYCLFQETRYPVMLLASALTAVNADCGIRSCLRGSFPGGGTGPETSGLVALTASFMRLDMSSFVQYHKAMPLALLFA